jgi:hypothetical protein
MGWMKDVKALLTEIADNTEKAATVAEDTYNLLDDAQRDAIRGDR